MKENSEKDRKAVRKCIADLRKESVMPQYRDKREELERCAEAMEKLLRKMELEATGKEHKGMVAARRKR